MEKAYALGDQCAATLHAMPEKPIKTSQRVFEILEAFETEQRPMALKDFTQGFGYPPSSASALLKSLVTLGFPASSFTTGLANAERYLVAHPINLPSPDSVGRARSCACHGFGDSVLRP